MIARFRTWLAVSPQRAYWASLFVVVNLFFLFNNLLGPLPHDSTVYTAVAFGQLLVQTLLYRMGRHELRFMELALCVGVVVMFVFLFGGLV